MCERMPLKSFIGRDVEPPRSHVRSSRELSAAQPCRGVARQGYFAAREKATVHRITQACTADIQEDGHRETDKPNDESLLLIVLHALKRGSIFAVWLNEE